MVYGGAFLQVPVAQAAIEDRRASTERQPGPFIGCGCGVNDSGHGGYALVGHHSVHSRLNRLPFGNHGAGFAPSGEFEHKRNGNPGQGDDDANRHQQFDQGKSPLAYRGPRLLWSKVSYGINFL